MTGDMWDDFFKEGGPFSVQANRVPGINSVAGLHDVFQVELGEIGGWERNIFNVPGMVLAAAISYGSLINDPAFVGVFSAYHDE